METNFYIGQEVVAIRDHSQGRWRKGEEFIIQGVKKEPCCGLITVNVGINSDLQFVECICGHITDNDFYYNSANFAPKQQLSETTYNEVMEWIKQGKPIEQLN